MGTHVDCKMGGGGGPLWILQTFLEGKLKESHPRLCCFEEMASDGDSDSSWLAVGYIVVMHCLSSVRSWLWKEGSPPPAVTSDLSMFASKSPPDYLGMSWSP